MKQISVLGDSLAILRMKKGYSLRTLSKLANVNYSTLNKIENNKQKTTPETAKKICKALDVSFDKIFSINSSLK